MPMTSTGFVGFFVFPALLFVLGYYPAVARFSSGLASPYAKAEIGKRFYAAMTDGLLVATSGFLYQRLESYPFLVAGALYLLVRDGLRGQSVGKFIFGLVVISLETGQPATLMRSVPRNVLFLLPGANVPAVFLEAMTMTRDVQGQRLGDRLAQTQVVEGFGAKDLVEALQRWWRSSFPEMGRAGRPGRGPVVVDR